MAWWHSGALYNLIPNNFSLHTSNSWSCSFMDSKWIQGPFPTVHWYPLGGAEKVWHWYHVVQSIRNTWSQCCSQPAINAIWYKRGCAYYRASSSWDSLVCQHRKQHVSRADRFGINMGTAGKRNIQNSANRRLSLLKWFIQMFFLSFFKYKEKNHETQFISKDTN